MSVRPATTADLPVLLDLERQCPTAAHWSRQQYEELFAATARSSRVVLIIDSASDRCAEDASQRDEFEAFETRILGFLIAHHIGPEWELENIVIAPGFRRKGLAMQLLAALLARARETNSESVFLEVRGSNRAARGLYARQGFEETGRRRLYYSNPAEDAVLYRLSLTQRSV